jgi:hypothetical protein
MFCTSPGPLSGGTTVFMQHLDTCIPDGQLYRLTSTKCRINTVLPPDEWPGEVRNM